MKEKLILGGILLSFAILATSLSIAIPLGEAPDEKAHFLYTQYIAQQRRLPLNTQERIDAGYRSDYPASYQIMAAVVGWTIETDGPQALKYIGDDARRLLVTDGLAGPVVLHTGDEAFPYAGIVRSWHLGRLLSVLFSVGALLLIYLILRQDFPVVWSLAGVAVIAVIPQFLAISAVLNDDSLLGFWVALFLWLLWPLFKHDGDWKRYLLLGLVAGAALATKYSAIFLAFDLLFLWLLLRKWPKLSQIGALILGGLLSAGWWFGYVIYYFNQIETLGWFRGSLASFLLVEADPSSARVAGALGVGPGQGALTSIFSLDWLAWWHRLFVSYWYPFIMAAWWWIPLLLLTLFVIWRVFQLSWQHNPFLQKTCFLAGHIFLFIPLLMLRYYLTGNIAETAQGRHLLFPTLAPMAALIIGSLYESKAPKAVAPGAWYTRVFRQIHHAPGATVRYQPGFVILGGLFLFLVTSLAVTVWPTVTLAKFPRLPVRTSQAANPAIPIGAAYRNEIELLGADIPNGPLREQAVPIEFIWQALDTPTADYTIRVTLFDKDDQPVGVWQGQPVNGRYPTRSWDKGDLISDQIWIPTFSESTPQRAVIELQDAQGQLISTGDGQLKVTIPLIALLVPASPEPLHILPRGDGYSPSDPYRFRAAISMIVSGRPDKILLRNRDGGEYAPTEMLQNETETIALFSVDWTWESGPYDLQLFDEAGAVTQSIAEAVIVQNNQRLVEIPPISRLVEANFNDQFLLLGYDLPIKQIEAGQPFEVTLIWQNLRTTNTDYKIFNHLLAADTYLQHGGEDRAPQDFYSTVLWQPGEIIVDKYAVPVDATAPPGIYWLDVGLYPSDSKDAPPLPLMADGTTIDANSVRLGPIKVGGQPERSMSLLSPDVVTMETFGGQISLAGYSIGAADTWLNLDFYWEATTKPVSDYTLFIHLVNENGELAAQADGPPVEGYYPTSFWETGETIFDERQLAIDHLPPGEYQIRLGWYNAVTGERLVVPGNPEGFIILGPYVKE